MDPQDLGYRTELERARIDAGLDRFQLGRVVAEHRDRFVVWTEIGDRDAEISGNLRHQALARTDLPAVGDWVALTHHDADLSIVHGIVPRFSTLTRQAAGRDGELQIIATNIDHALLIQASDRDFNLNRLERYLALCHGAGISPIVVLSKADLITSEELETLRSMVQERVPDAPLICLSSHTGQGVETLLEHILPRRTYCLLGSSGVGKSTLVNTLSGRARMRTDALSSSTNKGRHITSHRELIVLENGGLLIDNPGMREVGVGDAGSGEETTFGPLARSCRFKDCSHTTEPGCAILEARAQGRIGEDAYANFMKLARETSHFESTLLERRRKDKAFGKMVKNFKKSSTDL
ncbi:MAG: ribosome small subunit-dependent GTPase A [Fibrobacteria bacterium]|nr:ribosome small subunit-dependent GTPase A [Fibrobacteria bacterium]